MTATERDSERITELRANFVEWMSTANPEKLVFLDECGVTTSMTPTHAYAPRGEPAVDRVPRNRGRVTTVLGAMDCDGMVGMMTIESGTTKEVFRDFLEQTVLLDVPVGHTLVMDNLGAHRAQLVRDACTVKGIHIKYLPPYSPEWNPIEKAWFWFKDSLAKRKARGREELADAAEELFHALPATHAKAWVTTCGYRVA